MYIQRQIRSAFLIIKCMHSTHVSHLYHYNWIAVRDMSQTVTTFLTGIPWWGIRDVIHQVSDITEQRKMLFLWGLLEGIELHTSGYVLLHL